MRNDVLETVIKELELLGIKPSVSHLSKHIEVCWQSPKGEPRRQVVPTSPSDVRGRLNARGDVRRILRADNHQPPTKEATTLIKAMSLPKTDSHGANRLARLEQDNEALLDMIVDQKVVIDELSALVAQTMAMIGSARVVFGNAQPEVVVEEPKVEAPAPVASNKGVTENGAPKDEVLKLLEYNAWTSVSDMKEALGTTNERLGATLTYLKKQKLVINGQRGYWKRTPADGANLPKASEA